MSKRMLSSLGAVAWLFVAGASHAAEIWPTKSIRFVCPYVAGGAADIFSRTIGQKLTNRRHRPDPTADPRIRRSPIFW